MGAGVVRTTRADECRGGGRCRTESGCGVHSKSMHARGVMVIVDGMCGVLSYRQGRFGENGKARDDAAAIIIGLLNPSTQWLNPSTQWGK